MLVLHFFCEQRYFFSHSNLKLEDSWAIQLLSTTYKIYATLDKTFEVRGVFRAISKAWDKFGYAYTKTTSSKQLNH